MKVTHFIILIIGIFFCHACESKKQKKDIISNTTENAYLGQKPPGLVPKRFAPKLVTTTDWEYNGVFSPDLNEFYYIRLDEKREKQLNVAYIKKDKQWVQKVISKRKGSPFFSSNNNIMYLGNSFSERTGNGNWSEIKKLDTPFDSLPIMRLSVSDKGTYFYDEFKRDFTGDIRYSRLVNGKHEKSKKLNAKINTGRSFHPFIAPDESYLLFDSEREGGHGDSDIYISFRQQDDSWSDPINLGNQINTAAWEAGASITPDGKYLFFNRIVGDVPYENDDYKNVDIFWVDAKVIENLRPKK
ncbi:TolB-like translocation protein [Tenacibaculum xiamenense]|uniref:hypothetical protein n=1 Tax=Tenacibaculum xiamenense TaxID=1261553 RepID=UPI003893E776